MFSVLLRESPSLDSEGFSLQKSTVEINPKLLFLVVPLPVQFSVKKMVENRTEPCYTSNLFTQELLLECSHVISNLVYNIPK
jgi:hypothetical protein